MSKFLIGCATAAHQVEGNNIHSDYWAMEHMKYQNFNEPSLIACDHYNRYEEDIKMMAESGLNAYRFSIEWARVEPEEGKFDEAEIAHYGKVIDCCHKYNIEPLVTLLHFTSPKWLIEKGGWENPEVVNYFEKYVRKVVGELGSKIHYICTINEANMGIQVAAIAKRYQIQMMAKMKAMQAAASKNNDAKPNAEGQAQVGMNFNAMMMGQKARKEEAKQVFGTEELQTFVSSRTPEGDALVGKCHMAARKVIKELYPAIQVGITLSLHDIQIAEGGEEKAKEEWEADLGHYLPYIKDDDFFGLQNYTRSIIGKDGQLPNPEGAKVTQMGYENYPEALGNVIRKVHKDFLKMPIIVTENGIATKDDAERCEFITKALKGVKECVEEGIPVKGYMYWSFCDNFEWQKGFSMQFGLVAVDRKTMERQKKPSLDLLGSYTEKFD